jgi:hypothetical protein
MALAQRGQQVERATSFECYRLLAGISRLPFTGINLCPIARQMMAKSGQKTARNWFCAGPQTCLKKIIVYFQQHKKKNSGFLGQVHNLALTCLGHSG